MNELDIEFVATMASVPEEDDGPIWMINLIQYHERAQYPEGYDEMDTDISGAEADARYAPVDILADIGAEIVFVGDVEDQLLGDSPKWDRVAVVRYPSRRAFLEMGQRQDFQQRVLHKRAGIETTIVALGIPMPDPMGDLRRRLPEWSTVEHPPTDDDGPMHVVHLVQFAPSEDSVDELGAYSSRAAEVAAPHGARVDAWFAIEGNAIGDGRRWDQVRFNSFPSRRAFVAVGMDPARLQAQREHRERSMSDTYTMIVRPLIDRIADSVADHS